MNDSFQDWLVRIPDVEITAYLGPALTKTLRLLDPNLASQRALRDFLLSQRGPASLLADKEFRARFFDCQPVASIKRIAAATILNAPVQDAETFSRMKRLSSSELDRVFDFFGVPQVDAEDEPTVETPGEVSADTQYGLFPHQRRALISLRGFIPGTLEKNRVVLHMPTGSGKTRTTMRLIAEYFLGTESRTVLWIANTEELCEQAASEFERAWSCIGNRPLKLLRMWGGKPIGKIPEEGMIVASAQTLHSIRSNLSDGTSRIQQIARDLGLLVFDEAHQALAETYSLVVDVISSLHQALPIIGLTATPGRTWADIEEDQRLADFFQGNKVKLKVEGFDSPVRYLIDAGYLADPTFVSHFHEWTDPDAVLDNVAQLHDADQALLAQVGADGGRNLLIRDALLDLSSRHSRVLYFAPSVENSDALAFILRQSRIDATSVTSKTPTADRRAILHQFLGPTESTMILCNYGILTTGFDAPRTSAAVIGRPTKSLVLYSQMVGRALRGPLAGGNRTCEIHTIVDTSLPGFNHPVAAFDNWEDVWANTEN